MTVAVIQFGGSNCDRDAVRALAHLGIDAALDWYEDGLLPETTGIMLPGGFSYGDYLRAGAMAARAPIMDRIREHVHDGLPILGVCNGAQIGCEAGLAPGAFTTNASARFQCEHVYVRVENAQSPWTAAYEEGAVLELPIAHGEGRYEADPDTLDKLARTNRVLFRYCDANGSVTEAANPNGSEDNIAGILGDEDHIALMMPHPERATLPDLGWTDGQGVLHGFRELA